MIGKRFAAVGAAALLLSAAAATSASAATSVTRTGTVNVCGNSFNGGPAGNTSCTNGQVSGNTGTLPAWILRLLGH